MKQQTAVEWLINKHFGGIENVTPDFKKHIEQAKEMEKQQIINANFDGQRLHAKSVTNLMMEDNAEQYYNEIFGGNK